MGGLLLLFSPELLILSFVALALLVWLLLHLRSFVRNTVVTAVLLLAWALQAGFVGFIVYVAAWVFMFPVMATLCGLVGITRTWAEARAVRELKRRARQRSDTWYVSDGMRKGAEIIRPGSPE